MGLRSPRSLRLSLITPIAAVLLALVPATVLGLMGEITSERMADSLIIARGHTALSGVENRLDAARRSKETLAQVLAADPMVVAATEAGDAQALGAVLIPIKARLEIQSVEVFDLNGRELLRLSPNDEIDGDNNIALQAEAGVTASAASIVTEGLLVEAATPIKAGSGVVGVIVVSRAYAGEALKDLASADGVQLALFDRGTPVSLPLALPDVPPERAYEMMVGSPRVVGNHYMPVSVELRDGQAIVALVDVSDMMAARLQSRLILAIGGTIVLLAATAMGWALSRRLTRPINSITAVARQVGAGDYNQRLPSLQFEELDLLGSTINELTTDVQTRIEALTSARQELTDALESKEHLVASVSHELRTPLTTIVGFSQLLDDPDSGLSTSDQNELIHQIASESIDLADIIEDLLVVSRVESGNLAVSKSPVDAAIQFRGVVGRLASHATNQQISVNLEPISVLGDAGRIRQIARNLVSNAIRYGGDNVDVSMVVRANYVELIVSDDGQEIPPGHRDRMFDAYERTSKHSGVTASIGLGLTVSRQLAQLMDGTLTFRRQHGRNFFVLTLPTAPQPHPVLTSTSHSRNA
jgi:signal transduction histidine kinase